MVRACFRALHLPCVSIPYPCCVKLQASFRPSQLCCKSCISVLKNQHAECVCSILAFCWSKDNPRPLRPKRSALRYHFACGFCTKSPPMRVVFYCKNLVSRRPFLFCCSSKGKRWVLPVLFNHLKKSTAMSSNIKQRLGGFNPWWAKIISCTRFAIASRTGF